MLSIWTSLKICHFGKELTAHCYLATPKLLKDAVANVTRVLTIYSIDTHFNPSLTDSF